MTCEEIQQEIDQLTNQSNVLQQSIQSGTASESKQYNQILPQDGYGGTYPAPPPPPMDSIAVMARINFLAGFTPVPMTLIGLYYNLYQTCISVEAQEASLAQTNAMLGSFKQQFIEQGC